MTIPHGKGVYIWQSWTLPTQTIVDAVKKLNLSHVVFKVANGIYRYPANYQPELRERVQALKAIGIQVFGYQYTMATNPQAEAETIVLQAKELGLDGIVIDAEKEYRPNKNAEARAYMTALRAVNAGQFSLGLSSYRYPVTHQPDFPWKEFSQVDYNYPQVYWVGSTNPAEQLIESYRQYSQLFPGVPYIPVGYAYHEGAYSGPTPGEIAEFLQAAHNFRGASFWKLEHILERGDWQQAIADAANHWDPPTPDPEPVDLAYVKTTLADLIDTAAALTEGLDNLYEYLVTNTKPTPDPTPDPDPEPEPPPPPPDPAPTYWTFQISTANDNDRAKAFTYKQNNKVGAHIAIEALTSDGRRLVFKDLNQIIYTMPEGPEIWDGGLRMFRLAPNYVLPDGTKPPNGLYIWKNQVTRIT